MLTEKEKDILILTGEVWNNFLELPELHPDDTNEFRAKIHDLQNMILSRSGYRVLHDIELTE